jgi:teichuronic acid biosynthesis glycosyltransferase TuaC
MGSSERHHATPYPTMNIGMKMQWPLVTVVAGQGNADVLFVTSAWPRDENTKSGIFVERQVESLRRRGIRCDVLVVRGYRSPFAYVSAAARLLTWNVTRRYRLVHAHGGEVALSARFYLRAPLLVSYLGSDLLGYPRLDGRVPPRGQLRRFVIRQHSRCASATTTKTLEMEAALPARVRRRNVVIPDGVDEQLFVPMPIHDARNALGWHDDERVVVFAANPTAAGKRFHLADAACRIASAKVGAIRLYVAHEIDPDRMPIVFSGADALIFTSSREGSPNVVKEAMMCNLPVVSTRAGDVEERLAKVEPSWVCDPDPDALGAALAECVADGRRSNGRMYASGLTLDAVAERILGQYRRAGVHLEVVPPNEPREATSQR